MVIYVVGNLKDDIITLSSEPIKHDNKEGNNMIRYSLLLKIHTQVLMLQAINLQLFLYCLLYLCNYSN